MLHLSSQPGSPFFALPIFLSTLSPLAIEKIRDPERKSRTQGLQTKQGLRPTYRFLQYWPKSEERVPLTTPLRLSRSFSFQYCNTSGCLSLVNPLFIIGIYWQQGHVVKWVQVKTSEGSFFLMLFQRLGRRSKSTRLLWRNTLPFVHKLEKVFHSTKTLLHWIIQYKPWSGTKAQKVSGLPMFFCFNRCFNFHR